MEARIGSEVEKGVLQAAPLKVELNRTTFSVKVDAITQP